MTDSRRSHAMLAVFLFAGPAAAGEVTLIVEAGAYTRRESPVRMSLPEASFGPAVRSALSSGPVAIRLTPLDGPGGAVIAQAEPGGREGGPVRLTWLVSAPIAAGSSARFRADLDRPLAEKGPWRIDRTPAALTLRHADKTVFRYNAAPVSSPDYGPIQHRDAYIHPAYSPSGALVTGDFSKSHPHHRGFFFAYAKAQARGGQLLDFWNIHANKGTIRSERVDDAPTGPVTARFTTHHRWKDKGGTLLLRESWDVEAFDVPGSPYWLFDLTVTQRAEGPPVEVLPYRYGGMAYRGPEPFVKGTLDVLTAEGRHRVDGNLKPTRWVDLTGPVADGSKDYAGALIADHPGNPNHPTVARIHPTSLPFVSFVPASDKTVVIARDEPTVFRYRILIHDGRPDADRDEQTWRDLADPPRARVEEAPLNGEASRRPARP